MRLLIVPLLTGLLGITFGTEIPKIVPKTQRVVPMMRSATRQDTWQIAGNYTWNSNGWLALMNGSGSGQTLTVHQVNVGASLGTGVLIHPAIFRITAATGTAITPTNANTGAAALPSQVVVYDALSSTTTKGSALSSCVLYAPSNTTISSALNTTLYHLIPDTEQSPITLAAGEGIVIIDSSLSSNEQLDITLIFSIS